LKAARGGCACVDLFRLTPLRHADLARPGERRWDTFTVEWEAATARRPWLESVKIVAAPGDAVESSPLESAGGLGHGRRGRVACRPLPVLDASDGSTFPSAGDASFYINNSRASKTPVKTGGIVAAFS
jgi:hypothetical protein